MSKALEGIRVIDMIESFECAVRSKLAELRNRRRRPQKVFFRYLGKVD